MALFALFLVDSEFKLIPRLNNKSEKLKGILKLLITERIVYDCSENNSLSVLHIVKYNSIIEFHLYMKKEESAKFHLIIE